MKTRSGFVSNSSTSSFMIASKGELTEDKIMEWLNTGKDSLFYCFAQEVAHFLATQYGDVIGSVDDLLAYWKDEYGYEFVNMEDYKRQLELVQEGWTLYFGAASDESYDDIAESWLCNVDIDYHTDGLIIEKEGGY